VSEPLAIDASIALNWCFPDEHDTYAYAVLDALENTSAMAPSLWAIELANAIAMGEKRKRLTRGEATRFLALVGSLPIHIDSQTAVRAFDHTLPLARTYVLTAYDAAYLELAMREGLVLATLDDQLRKAARKAGVKVFHAT
jgi:predicted nucleic acid-binding protein